MQEVITNAVTGEVTVRDLSPEEIAAIEARRAMQAIEAAKTVTPRQARLALYGAGLLEQVEAAIAAADKATQLTWEYAVEFKREDPLINSLGQQLGLTSSQIDNLFLAASKL